MKKSKTVKTELICGVLAASLPLVGNASSPVDTNNAVFFGKQVAVYNASGAVQESGVDQSAAVPTSGNDATSNATDADTSETGMDWGDWGDWGDDW